MPPGRPGQGEIPKRMPPKRPQVDIAPQQKELTPSRPPPEIPCSTPPPQRQERPLPSPKDSSLKPVLNEITSVPTVNSPGVPPKPTTLFQNDVPETPTKPEPVVQVPEPVESPVTPPKPVIPIPVPVVSPAMPVKPTSLGDTSSPRKSDSATAIAELDMFSKGGQVWKRKNKKALSAWKQRYFHLKGGRILYYASVNDIKALGDIDLVVTQISLADKRDKGKESSHKWVFKMTTFGSEYHIATETEEELNQWMNTINRVKEHIFANGLQLERNISTPKKSKRGVKSRLTGTLRRKGTSSDFAISGSGTFQQSSPGVGGVSGLAAVREEIMTTERDYLKDLNIVKDLYIFKLEDYGLLQRDQKDAIFGNIEDLIPLHEDLLARLEEEYVLPSPDFGKIFKDIAPRFNIYSHYCTAQASAAEIIEDINTQNPNFGLCLEVCCL